MEDPSPEESSPGEASQQAQQDTQQDARPSDLEAQSAQRAAMALLQELLVATTAQREAFLTFVTSIPVKVQGRIELVPVVKQGQVNEIAMFSDPQYLPRARTCSSTLYLPRFESRKQLHDVLWPIVDAELKHKGFFEWTGRAGD